MLAPAIRRDDHPDSYQVADNRRVALQLTSRTPASSRSVAPARAIQCDPSRFDFTGYTVQTSGASTEWRGTTPGNLPGIIPIASFRGTEPAIRIQPRSGGLVFLVMGTTGTALLAATILFINGCPSAALGFLFRDTPLLVSFLDVLCLPLLLVGIGGLVSTWHRSCSFPTTSHVAYSAYELRKSRTETSRCDSNTN